MEYSNAQFILFCLALMLATLGYALVRINNANKRGETLRETPARWAILSAFIVCGLAFVHVAMDGYHRKNVEESQAQAIHKAPDVLELGSKP